MLVSSNTPILVASGYKPLAVKFNPRVKQETSSICPLAEPMLVPANRVKATAPRMGMVMPAVLDVP